MVELFKNKTFVIVLILAIIAIVTWYYFYTKGKSVPTTVVPVQDNPGSTSSTNNPAGLADSDIKLLVDNAHKDATSYWTSFVGHDASVYIPLSALSDTDFEKAYDIWNTEYQAQDQKTMRGIIDGIWAWFADGISLGSTSNFGTVQQSLDDKFNRLNLP